MWRGFFSGSVPEWEFCFTEMGGACYVQCSLRAGGRVLPASCIGPFGSKQPQAQECRD